jgi:hypothetical protein
VRLCSAETTVRVFERAAHQSSGIDAIDGGTHELR